MNAESTERSRVVVRPRQERSRKSLDELVSAAETLLKSRPLEAISVGEICRAAGLTTGAFYARFPSKEALMPLLYQRYQDWLAVEGKARFDAVKWETLSLEEAGEQIGRVLIGFFRKRTWLLRAATLFARARSDTWPSGSPVARSVVAEGIARALASHVKPDRPDAVRFVTFVATSVAREAMLFANAPMAKAGVKRTRLARDIGNLICGYLTTVGATKRAAKK